MKVELRVRELASGRGWGARELASQAGLDVQTAQAVMAGEAVEIDLTTLGHLAQVFDVLPNELVTHVEEPQPSIIETGVAPRSIHVPVQDMDQIKKEPTDPLDPATPAERLEPSRGEEPSPGPALNPSNRPRRQGRTSRIY
jgi:transcriptional regulator with XRE-family HTH domain